MNTPSTNPVRRMLPGIDRGLAAIIVGALLLIALGLIAIPLAARRAPALAPATTPEGTVQRFYQAAYAGDYSGAYAYLSADTQRALSLIELQQQLSSDLRRSQVHVGSVNASSAQATVQVMLTHFTADGIFGSSEWREERQILLRQEAGGWKIVSGPVYVPVLKDRG